jgi:hypothetical protein
LGHSRGLPGVAQGSAGLLSGGSALIEAQHVLDTTQVPGTAKDLVHHETAERGLRVHGQAANYFDALTIVHSAEDPAGEFAPQGCSGQAYAVPVNVFPHDGHATVGAVFDSENYFDADVSEDFPEGHVPVESGVW